MKDDYVGYYTFNKKSSSTSDQYIYKITSVKVDSSGKRVGYSYVTYGTTSKEKAQTNINNSAVKSYIDTWYENNIKGTTDEKYIVDNIFCNDRSISSDNLNGSYSNLGYGAEKTIYRWYHFADSSSNNKMMLICPQQNDAFTVSDKSKGNGALTYGVGLITTDEVVLGGGWSSNNSNYYLYTGQNYWTSSPYEYSGSMASERFISSRGSVYDMISSDVYINSEYGVRPVINLSSEVLNNGDGTASNPFHP